MTVIASGDNLVLRDCLESDIDHIVYWQTHGEWRLLDAPFEGVYDQLTEEQESNTRKYYQKLCVDELPSPRKIAIIAGNDNSPCGWVVRYGEDRTPETWMVGIDICEDEKLNRGLGTEALSLWLDYLFTNSTVHRVGLDTWSLNPRMSHVAKRLGFAFEGIQREIVKWEGKWLDLLHFGMLRSEWEENRKKIDSD
jgi:RimJ/RimL family protein N-acetyltransferase